MAVLAAILVAAPARAEDAVSATNSTASTSPEPAASPAPASNSVPSTSPAPSAPAPAAWKSDGSWGYNTAYAGAVFRPQFCLHGCVQSNRWQNRYLLTYGVEVGDRWFGLAFRYGQEVRHDPVAGVTRTAQVVATDLRGFHAFQVGPVLLTPFLEFSPTILFGGVTGVHLVVRPGFRVTVLLARFLDLAVEPFALDVDWYRWERYGSFRGADFSVALRYSISLSMHYRW